MNYIKQLHDGGAIVGNSNAALVVVDELVHAPRPQRGPHHIGHRCASVYIAHQLRLPLRRVRSLLQQYDLGLLFSFSIFSVQAFSQTVSKPNTEKEEESQIVAHTPRK